MKRLAIAAGIIFILAGAAGFVPALCPSGLLFGLFAVTEMHNIVHIATGVLALLLAFGGGTSARVFFCIAGVVYAVVAVLGFMHVQGGPVGMLGMNTADNYLHAVLAVIGLWIGFFMHRSVMPPPSGPGRDLREWA